MKKYMITIGINTKNAFKSNNEMSYDFGHTKGISIKLEMNKAIINMKLTGLKSFDDFTSFNVKQFRDAYRKVYLMHILLYGINIDVKKLYISINGDERVYCNSDANFPFMFSMIRIPNTSRINTFTWEMVKAIVDRPKTRQDDDKRYACLYAFLCSIGRDYYIDRFTNLWTAMNAFYNRLAEMFDESLKNEIRFDGNELITKLSFYKRDEMGVDAMISLFGSSGIVNGLRTEKTEIDCIHEMSDYLRKWSVDGYDSMLQAIKDKNYKDERVLELKEYANQMGVDEYSWLLFRFAYLVRCNYLHGNRVSPVISAYNDPEIIIFEALSCVLADFLNNNIKWLFETNHLSSEQYELLLRFVANYVTSKNLPFVQKKNVSNMLEHFGYINKVQ